MTISKSTSYAGVRGTIRMFLALVLSALAGVVSHASAQQSPAATQTAPVERVDAELYQALLDLTNPWTVMCVAAHPDDEDGATLTLLRRKYGAHTVTVFSTYGEGGQNATGPELYEELGAIRERETREASAIQGSEPYFLGLRDFGFSKSADEAFRVWGHTEALRLMVLHIRRLRPDVIITNHDTTSGHGHHQATGRLAQEAFDAAADPARFPEQLQNEGVSVWQAQRLFVRARSTEGAAAANRTAGNEATRAGALVSIDANARDGARGGTYAEQALRALQRHATQGPWPQTVPASGLPPIRYRLTLSSKQAAPLPSNAASLLEGLSLPEAVAAKLAPPEAKSLMALYSGESQRQRALKALINARQGRLFEGSNDDRPRFILMTERLDRALAVASGVSIKFEPRKEPLIPGRPATFNLTLANRGGAEITAQSLSFSGGRQPAMPLLKAPMRVAPGKPFAVTAHYDQTRDLTINVPHSEHLYDGRASGEQFRADAVINLSGALFPVAAKMTVDVVPAVEIASLLPSPLVVTPALVSPASGSGNGPRQQIVTFNFRLINHRDTPFNGEIRTDSPTDQSSSEPRAVSLPPQQSFEVLTRVASPFTIMDSGQGGLRPVPDSISFSVVRDNSSDLITRRKVAVVWSNARVDTRLRVGYIRSFDDTLRDALEALGVKARELRVEDVRAGKLAGYDTIIIDNRGYQAHPELVEANARLLEYVHAGGTLVVFYHKTNEWNPDPSKGRPQLAPYPITLGNERVTDENAAVSFLDPQHPLLNSPNKLTQDDFKGWIQERGLYYPQQWDDRYSAPLASSDTGEQPLRGGLLAADYGRGRYLYTSMVWYRQLRAGVPGAYRMLANLLSYGHADRATK